MKLHKAIEILSNPIYDTYRTVNPDFPDAIKLGIEALKRFQQARRAGGPTDTSLLPGESPPTAPSPSKGEVKKLLESPLGREPK